MVPLVGGQMGEFGGNDEISDGFGRGEGNNSFGQQRVRMMFLFLNLKL